MTGRAATRAAARRAAEGLINGSVPFTLAEACRAAGKAAAVAVDDPIIQMADRALRVARQGGVIKFDGKRWIPANWLPEV